MIFMCALLHTTLSILTLFSLLDYSHAVRLNIEQIERRISKAGSTLLRSGIAVLNNEGYAYLIHINVGGQDFPVIFDTGSADLWIVSSECSQADCEGILKFHANKSQSFSPTPSPFTLQYLLGSVTGLVAEDTVTIGSYQVSSQVFALANKTQGMNLFSANSSGVLGLGFPSIASIPESSGQIVIGNLFSHLNDEKDRFFAFRLGRYPSTLNMDTSDISSFTIADLDPLFANSTEDMTLHKVYPINGEEPTTYDFWKLPMHALTVRINPGGPINETSHLVPLSPSRVVGSKRPLAVLDSGTTLILGPTVDVDRLYTALGKDSTRIGPAGLWQIKCDRAAVIGIVLGNIGDQVPPSEYLLDPRDTVWMRNAGFQGWCMGGVQANDKVNSGEWLLGDVFLRNVYVSHHAQTESTPPLIGLRPLTTPDSLLQTLEVFRKERGSDPRPVPDLPQSNWKDVITEAYTIGTMKEERKSNTFIYIASCAAGFVVGAAGAGSVRAKMARGN